VTVRATKPGDVDALLQLQKTGLPHYYTGGVTIWPTKLEIFPEG
jgi:hypothetical protein